MKLGARKPDWYIFCVVAALVGIGIIMVFSSSQYFAQYEYDNVYHFLKKQLLHAAIGFIGMFCAYQFGYKKLRYLSYPIFAVVLVLLAAVLLTSAGDEAGGAERWLNLGGFRFQPSELSKLAAVLAVSKYISINYRRMDTGKYGFWPLLALMGVTCGLVFKQNDLSTAAVIAGTLFIMMFVGGVQLRYLFGTMIAGAAAVLAIILGTFRIARISAWLDPWSDPQGYGFQAIQSLLAIGSGGLTGVGLGAGGSKWYYLPERHTDFIFSVLCEELGFLGGLIVIALFAIFVWRGLVVAVKCEDTFGAMVALGITTMIGLQAFLNLGVATGLVPVTGITLPFVSYGGTSLVMSLTSVGLLLDISSKTGEK
ncbi:MAG: putative lipid II flippase FtsW [Clostridia bacterium]|nr:putative lipid II flippase FtsW [Clostridia bacterium]MDD4798250.1 putative lipid II flippase FtsW [Clostridia bacterium]